LRKESVPIAIGMRCNRLISGWPKASDSYRIAREVAVPLDSDRGRLRFASLFFILFDIRESCITQTKFCNGCNHFGDICIDLSRFLYYYSQKNF
jgi:hypothetical protein